jgi:tRNA A37 threonylcarbamoyladenosine synthetase subunit TsaC/SUA5/YrdC
VRIPDHPVVRALLRELGKPLVSSTLLMSGEDEPMSDGWTIKDRFEREIELHGDLDAAQRAKIFDIAMHCPVHLTLERGSEIETRLVPPPAPAAAMTLGHHARDIAVAGEVVGLSPDG